jgi:hypothetical protein
MYVKQRPWLVRTLTQASSTQCDLIGWIFAYWALFSLESFMKIREGDLGRVLSIFPQKKASINFWPERVGLPFGRFFHKLIWSHCSHTHKPGVQKPLLDSRTSSRHRCPGWAYVRTWQRDQKWANLGATVFKKKLFLRVLEFSISVVKHHSQLVTRNPRS